MIWVVRAAVAFGAFMLFWDMALYLAKGGMGEFLLMMAQSVVMVFLVRVWRQLEDVHSGRRGE